MDFSHGVGQWFYTADGQQAMFSTAEAVEAHYKMGWRQSLEEAMELQFEQRVKPKIEFDGPILASPLGPDPVMVDPNEARKRKNRERTAAYRAAKKAKKANK